MGDIFTKIVEVAFAKGAFPSAIALILLFWFLREWTNMKKRETKLLETLQNIGEKLINLAEDLQSKRTKTHKSEQKRTSGGRKH